MDNMKKVLYFTALILLLSAVLFFKYFTCVIYVNPQTNTDVLTYITPVINKLNKDIKYAVNTLNTEGYKVRLIYTNAYGSGFLKGNSIPNDLDYSVGIHLGAYDYDGTNEEEIADRIFKEINSFYSSLYYNLSGDFYSAYSKFAALNLSPLYEQQQFASSIKKITEEKDYVIYTKKQLEFSNPPKYITFPFAMKANELLIEDMPPVTVYSNEITYSKNDKIYPKEISIVPDYIFVLKDIKTNKKYNIEIVGESFKGQRLQLSRRFFVPQIFIGMQSFYIKTFPFLRDKEKYIEYRLFNFERLLTEVSNLTLTNDRPVKKMKRILQIENLIEPAINPEKSQKIKTMISENLAKQEVQALNDYSNIYGNILTIMQTPKIFFDMQNDGQIKNYLNIMLAQLDLLSKSSEIDKNSLKFLKEYTENNFNKITEIKDQKELDEFLISAFSDADKISKNVQNCFKSVIKNQEEMNNFIKEIEKLYTDAGFHKIDMGWIKEGTLGIVKDDFTKNLTKDELKQLAKENNLADVNYILINPVDMNKIYVKHTVRVRFNSSKTENDNWLKLKTKLLEDKKNFNLKYKFL